MKLNKYLLFNTVLTIIVLTSITTTGQSLEIIESGKDSALYVKGKVSTKVAACLDSKPPSSQIADESIVLKYIDTEEIALVILINLLSGTAGIMVVWTIALILDWI